MITLYQFPASYGMDVSVSPYCAKVELYFRLTQREYETAKGSVLASPNKAVPYVRWDDGQIEAESDDIIARLEAQGPTLDEGLDDAARSRGRELQARAQHDIYFSCLHHRFADAQTWPLQRETVKALVPLLLSPVLTRVIRGSQIKKCRQNGFSTTEDYAKGVAAVEALSEALGEQAYMLGDQPRTADCGVWGALANCASTTTPNPVRDAIRSDERLMGYLRRLSSDADLTMPL